MGVWGVYVHGGCKRDVTGSYGGRIGGCNRDVGGMSCLAPNNSFRPFCFFVQNFFSLNNVFIALLNICFVTPSDPSSAAKSFGV